MKKTNKTAVLAAKYACNERTLRRWKAAGAPLENFGKMKHWLSGQKNLPAGTRAVLAAAPVRRAAGPPAAAGQTGAAAALGRLAVAEEAAYAAFVERPDRGTRETWLKVSESLRKFDLAIEENRRETGELIPREDAERILKAGGYLFRVACQSCGDAAAERLRAASGCDHAVAQVAARELVIERVLGTMATLARPDCPGLSLPPWGLKAFTGDARGNVCGPGFDEWLAKAGATLVTLEMARAGKLE